MLCYVTRLISVSVLSTLGTIRADNIGFEKRSPSINHNNYCVLFVSRVFVDLIIPHFGSEDRVLVLIVQIPGHCLPFISIANILLSIAYTVPQVVTSIQMKGTSQNRKQ